jgi:hypothetical protein
MNIRGSKSKSLVFACLALLLAISATRSSAELSADQQQRAQLVVDRVNLYRKLSGLQPVTLDPALCDGCFKHAHYLDIQPNLNLSLDIHNEDPAQPGYTPEGQLAGLTSDITLFSGSGATDPTRTVEFDYNSLYHRTPMLGQNLLTIGYGDNVGGQSKFRITLLRFGQFDSAHNLLTPPPNSAGIRCSGGGKEVPPPTPKFGTKTGNPIVAYFFDSGPVTWVNSTVTAKGKKMTHTVIAPNKPVNPSYEGNLICLITDKPFPKNAVVQVSIDYTEAGVAKNVSWSFNTAAKGIFDPVAAAASPAANGP